MRAEGDADAQLLHASVHGDAGAFTVLVRRHIRAATLLAAQLLGDTDDAEDVVQEAFTIVHDRARGFDAARPFAPWLYGIVRRLAMNRRAREVRRTRLMRLWGATSIRSNVVEQDDSIDARIDVNAVRGAISSLPPMQRACFELVVLHDIAIPEVASMHGIAESTVRQHVFRAQRAIRGMLEPREAGDASLDSGGDAGGERADSGAAP